MSEKDQPFFDRADEFIRIANTQMEKGVEAGQISASFMYGLARYSAWFSASGWKNSQDMAAAKAETLAFFVAEYEKMLEMNLDDYIQHFETYIEASRKIQKQG